MQNKAENERALALRVPGHPGLSDAKKLVLFQFQLFRLQKQ